MAEPIKFTELSNVGNLSASAIMAVVQQQGGELVSLQCSAAQMADLISSDIEYQNLTTEGKTLIEAINEAAQTGGGGDVSKAYVDAENAKQDAETATIKADLTEQSESLEALWKLNKGISYDFANKVERGLSVNPAGTYSKSLLDVRGESRQESTNGYNLSVVKDWTNTETDTQDNLNFLIGSYNGETAIIEGRVHKSITSNGKYTLTANFSNVDFTKIRIKHNGLMRDLVVEDVAINEKGVYTVSFEIEGFDPKIVGGIIIKNLMLEKGSVAHPYEPYTGGIPSPNPDYPQEITPVEEINVKVNGKNLFNQTDLSQKGFWYSNNNGVLEKNTNWCAYLVPIVGGASYTFSGIGTNNASMPWFDSDMNYISNFQRGNKTVVAPTNAKYLGFNWVWNETSPAYDGTTIQIELGSVATPYESYTETTKTIIPPFALNGVGDAFDFADVDKGVWIKSIGKYVITGDESWTYHNSALGTSGRFFTVANLGQKSSVDGTQGLFNYFTTGTLRVNGHGFVGTDTIQVRNDAYTSSDLREGARLIAQFFKDLFNRGEPCVAYFNLANPTETPIDLADLEFLRSLTNLDKSKSLLITDQNGKDISYLLEYIIKLSEVN